MTRPFLYQASEYAGDPDIPFWRSIRDAVVEGDAVETRVDHTGTVDVDVWTATDAASDPATALQSAGDIARAVAFAWIESWGGGDTGELHERVEDSATAAAVINAADRLRDAFSQAVDMLTAVNYLTTATVHYTVDGGNVVITLTEIPGDLTGL